MPRAALFVVALTLFACSEPLPGEGNWALELQLDSPSAAVGEPVGYRAELVSEEGARRAVVVTLGSDLEPSLAYTATSLTATMAGAHTVTATATEGGVTFTDEASLTVGGGAAATLELSLSSESPAVGQRVEATAVIRDSFGNVVDASWTLTVASEPGTTPGTAMVEGHFVTFTDQGWFTATGTVDGRAISDSVGPLLVDSFSPLIHITNPERGTMTTSYADTVTGTITDAFSSVTSATVNGQEVTLGPDGGFSEPISYDFGFNLVETVATDEGNHTSTDRRAVLAGEFIAPGDGLAQGIVARVNQSTLDQIEGFGEAMIDGFDINSVIPNPLYNNESETCVFGICVTTYALTLRVSNVRRGASELELTPNDGGWIDVRATVRDVSVDWSATGVLLEISYTGTGTITADAVHVTGRLTPSVTGGQISLDVSNVDVSSDNFVFDWDSWIYDVANFFGLDASGMVQGYVEGAIEGAVVSEVPPLVEGVLQGLELVQSFDLFGNTYQLEARPDSVSVDGSGITLGLETRLTPLEWRLADTGPGSLYAGYEAPSFGATPGLLAAFSLDFLNQALHAFWGGGLLAQELDPAALGFDTALLGLMLEPLGATEMIVVNALLPPVVLPGTEGHLADLRAGDVEVTFHSGDPDDPDTLLLHLFIGLEAALDLTVVPERNTLAATLTDVHAWVDVTEPVLPHNFEIDTELLLLTLLPVITGQITDALGELPIPEIYGFSLLDPTISPMSDGGYVTVAGELTGL